jgi:hypothetical protein
VDEYQRLGFSTWRSACRVDGISFHSLVSFTWQLLPNAIVGLLMGGLAVTALGFVLRARGNSAAECLAAHLGCMLTMPLGLVLCALALPSSVMPLADAALATIAGWLLMHLLLDRRRANRAHP